VDWLAHNLPTVGDLADRPTVGSKLRTDVPPARPDETIGAIRARVDASPYRFALVVAADTTLLGRLRHATLTGDPDRVAIDAAEPGPATIRPHQPLTETAEQLRRDDLTYAVVTTPEGHLLGILYRNDLPQPQTPADPT
jgi:Mg/Co/Ni transporter MgtE